MTKIDHEGARLQFIVNRDGLEATEEFARRTLAKYRECLLLKRRVLNARGEQQRKPHHATLPQYRRSFVESCVSFRRFLRRAQAHRLSSPVPEAAKRATVSVASPSKVLEYVSEDQFKITARGVTVYMTRAPFDFTDRSVLYGPALIDGVLRDVIGIDAWCIPTIRAGTGIGLVVKDPK